jgi:hypothetical protein
MVSCAHDFVRAYSGQPLASPIPDYDLAPRIEDEGGNNEMLDQADSVRLRNIGCSREAPSGRIPHTREPNERFQGALLLPRIDYGASSVEGRLE